jgi:hypothetical protein
VQVLTAFAMMNLEGEGIEDIRAYFRKQLVNDRARSSPPRKSSRNWTGRGAEPAARPAERNT